MRTTLGTSETSKGFFSLPVFTRSIAPTNDPAPPTEIPTDVSGQTSKSRLKKLAKLAVAGTLAGTDLGVAAVKASLMGVLRGLTPFNGKRLTEEVPALRPLARTTKTTKELLGATVELLKQAALRNHGKKDAALDAALGKLLQLFAVDALVNGPWADPGAYHGAITGGASVPRKWGRLIGLSKNWTTRRPPEDLADDWKRGMKRWHATTNAIVASNANLAELLGLYLAGWAHEIDPASFEAELSGQGKGVWSDSLLDLTANFAGLSVGLLVGNDDPFVLSRLVNRFAELIPGPPDPFESEKMDLASAVQVKQQFELSTIALFLEQAQFTDDKKVDALVASLPPDDSKLLESIFTLVWNLEIQPEGQPRRRMTEQERDGLANEITRSSASSPVWAALLTKAQSFMDTEVRAGRDPWFPNDASLPAPKTWANLKKAIGDLDDVLSERLKPLAEGGSLRKTLEASTGQPTS